MGGPWLITFCANAPLPCSVPPTKLALCPAPDAPATQHADDAAAAEHAAQATQQSQHAGGHTTGLGGAGIGDASIADARDTAAVAATTAARPVVQVGSCRDLPTADGPSLAMPTLEAIEEPADSCIFEVSTQPSLELTSSSEGSRTSTGSSSVVPEDLEDRFRAVAIGSACSQMLPDSVAIPVADV